MKLIDTNNSKRIYKRNGDQIMTYDLNITFDDNLITGNKTIDTQHKELIDRIQNFVTACQNGDSKVKAIISKKRKSFRKTLVIQREKCITKNMKSLKRQFRNCMNTLRIMKDQRISSVNLYRKMWLTGCLDTLKHMTAL